MKGDSPEDVGFDATLTTANERGSSDKSSDLVRGSRISRYTILDRLGDGGMGVVYGAYDPDLDRKVALKILHERGDGTDSDQARSRLLREARAMGKLNHPNVITVYDVATVGDRDFITMERVDGHSLAEWLGMPRAQKEILRAFVDAGRGLAAAHQAGLIHRDFKPSNVLIGEDGGVRVTDFGLARADRVDDIDLSESIIAGADTLDTPDVRNLTRTGAVIGTPAYMSPEQHTARRTDPRSDQFSFCVALYEALYGELPFPGGTLGELREAVLGGAVAAEPKASDVPAAVRKVLLRGLCPTPSDRYESMDALLAALAPEPSSRLVYAIGGATAVVAAAVALIVFGSDTAGTAPCEDAGSEIDQIWNSDVKRNLRSVFGSDQTEFFDRFAAVVDSYARDWRSTAKSVCAERAVKSRTSEQDYLLQQSCLLERKSAVESMASVLGRADARTVEQAIEVARGLPGVRDCTDLVSLRAGIRPPESTEAARRIEEIRQRLGGVRVLRDALRYSEAIQSAEHALSDARDMDYPPLVAEAMLELGIAQGRAKNAAAARESLREAELLAEETGHDRVRASALVEQVGLEARFSSDHDRARELGRRAAAAIKRRNDASLQAELDHYLARVSLDTADYDDAVARFERSLEAFREVSGSRSKDVADALSRLAAVRELLGRREESLELHREALEIREAIYPRDHPEVILGTEAVAGALWEVGKIDDANEMLASVAPFWESGRGRETLREVVAGEKIDVPMRAVSGRVVDSQGAFVSGALVLAGLRIVMDGKRFDMRKGGVMEARLHMARATTDSAGEFEIRGPRDEAFAVAAEQPDLGRSRIELVTPEHNGSLQLSLRPFGRVEGTVAGGTDELQIVAFATDAHLPAPNISGPVASVRDGAFAIERIAAGKYVVLAQTLGNRGGIRVESQTVRVSAGATTRVKLEIEAAGTEVTVRVTDESGRDHPGVQVVLVPGDFDARDVKVFNARVAERLDQLQIKTAPLEPIVFSGVRPGRYSVCVIPLPRDPKDPVLIQLDQEKLAVHCRATDIDGDTMELDEKAPRAVPLEREE